jgi:hypothetical protein
MRSPLGEEAEFGVLKGNFSFVHPTQPEQMTSMEHTSQLTAP